jgi:hypothetical protein
MKTVREWLEDPALFATSAMALLVDAWGTEFIEWDPVTVSMELEGDFGVEVPGEIQDRIQAACALLTSNLFFVSIETFMMTCDAFNFGSVASEIMVPADLDDVLWGVTEARLLLGDDFDENEFGHDVSRYVGLLLSESGVKRPPSVLQFAEFDAAEQLREDDSFDDDVLHQVFWQSQEDDKARLEADNNIQLMLLFRQLAQLPLKSGNADFIRERLSNITPRQRPEVA